MKLGLFIHFLEGISKIKSDLHLYLVCNRYPIVKLLKFGINYRNKMLSINKCFFLSLPSLVLCKRVAAPQSSICNL